MRLIDADTLIPKEVHTIIRLTATGEQTESVVYAEQIDNAPTVDAVERKRGRWIDEPVYKQTMDGRTWDGYTYCSECREMHEYGYRSNFCPSCGAEIGKGEEE